MNLNFLPIKTRIVHPPKDNLTDIFDSLDLKDGDIVFITSKIVSIMEGNTVPTKDTTKEELAKKEASHFLSYASPSGDFHVNLTINKNMLIPSAGIDASNADGYFVIWPEDPDESCKNIRNYLMKRFSLKRLGVVMTDSHTSPMRLGVTGITLGFSGVEPLKDIRGRSDLFGRTMKVTKINLLDPLSSMAVLLMGETDECTPICVLRDYKGIPFSDSFSMADFSIEKENDYYAPLLDVIPKIK